MGHYISSVSSLWILYSNFCITLLTSKVVNLFSANTQVKQFHLNALFIIFHFFMVDNKSKFINIKTMNVWISEIIDVQSLGNFDRRASNNQLDFPFPYHALCRSIAHRAQTF